MEGRAARSRGPGAPRRAEGHASEHVARRARRPAGDLAHVDGPVGAMRNFTHRGFAAVQVANAAGGGAGARAGDATVDGRPAGVRQGWIRARRCMSGRPARTIRSRGSPCSSRRRTASMPFTVSPVMFTVTSSPRTSWWRTAGRGSWTSGSSAPQTGSARTRSSPDRSPTWIRSLTRARLLARDRPVLVRGDHLLPAAARDPVRGRAAPLTHQALAEAGFDRVGMALAYALSPQPSRDRPSAGPSRSSSG